MHVYVTQEKDPQKMQRYTRNILRTANKENTSDDRSVECATLLTHTRGCSVNVSGGRDGLTNSVSKDERRRGESYLGHLRLNSLSL